MKQLILLISFAVVLGATSVHSAGPPSLTAADFQQINQLVPDYLATLRKGDYSAMARLYHPDELANFVSGMKEGVKLLDQEGDLELLTGFFPGIKGTEYFDQHDAATIFANFMKAMAGTAELGEMLRSAEAEHLGSLPESADRACVVVKLRFAAEGGPIEVYEVMPIRKAKEGWRIAMKGDLKRIIANIAGD